MSRAASWLLAIGAGLVLYALRNPVAYDFQRYTVISGFEASRWTWLLIVCGGVLAVVAVSMRDRVAALTRIVSAIAAASVAITIVWTVRTTPHRHDQVGRDLDCTNQNIGIGCRLHQGLDAL